MAAINNRSSNITNEYMGVILFIIQNWDHGKKITWDKLVNEIETKIGECYSRQALAKHEPIKKAYAIAVKKFAKLKSKRKSPRDLIEENKSLEKKCEVLEQVNKDLFILLEKLSHDSTPRNLNEQTPFLEEKAI